jgi:hypothetical protein
MLLSKSDCCATFPAAAGVILESEEIHRMAYNATFEHFDVRCPGGEGPVVWTEEYYEDLQNRVGASVVFVCRPRPARLARHATRVRGQCSQPPGLAPACQAVA